MSDLRLRNHRFDTARPAMTPPPHPRRRAWLCRAGLALVLSAGGLPAGAWNARGHAAIAVRADDAASGAATEAVADSSAGTSARADSAVACADGNTVEMATEQTAFAENALAYRSSLSFLQGRVNTLTRAIKGE